MNRDEMKAAAIQVAQGQNIDPELFSAIIEVESSWNPFSVRYEPAWAYFYFPRELAGNLDITIETETKCQMMSWGLCQVMGSLAREMGHRDLLTRLIDPSTSLIYGAKNIRNKMNRFGPVESDIIAAYNAGSPRKTVGGLYENQSYVDKVDLALRKIRG